MYQDLLILGETATGEDDRVEFKREFSPERKAAFWVELVKDVVAMANTNGGIIVFGINDDGTDSQIDCTSLLSFDKAKFTDQIAKYTGVQYSDFQFTELARQNGRFPAIVIMPTRVRTH